MNLSEFRVDDTPIPEYIPTLPHDGYVLAFDQAIRKTGWVFIRGEANKVSVIKSGTLRTPDLARKGWASTYIHAMAMYELIGEVFADFDGIVVDHVVHEMPPVGKLARPDASIMGGMGVRICHSRWMNGKAPLLMISKQKAANLLTGNPNSKKIKVSDYLRNTSWISGIEVIESKSYKEDQYDALALAIPALAIGADDAG